MKDSTRQSKQKSSEKEKHDGKNFRIPISNGIFEHYARLKDARWLLDLFIDWTTQEVPAPDGSRDGLVLGGKPIRDEDTARAFGCTKRTTRRWRLRLAQFAYISQERTPLGYVIRVKKSKKWTSQNKQTEWTKMSTHSESELPNVSTQSARNGNSELPNVSTHSVSILMDNTKTVAVDREGAASPSTGNRKTEKAASLADSLLVGKTPEAWRKIGCSPLGSAQVKKLLNLRNVSLLLLLLLSPLGARATTVSGNLKSLGVANVTGGNTFVRFTLTGYGSNIPRVTGTNVIVADHQDFSPDASGNISGSIQGNDTISVGANPAGGTWYNVCIYYQGQQFRCNNYTINGGTFDLTSATPNTTNPTITAPTGDNTYVRKDAGNGPYSGNYTLSGGQNLLTAYSLNNVQWVDGVKYTTLSACYAALPSGGGACMVPPNYSETMSASLTMSKSGSGFIFTGPANITMGTNQFIIPGNTHGVFFEGTVGWGGDIFLNGAKFVYTGTDAAFKVGDGAGTTDRVFRMKNIAITINQANARGISLTNVVYFSLDNISVNGSSVANTIGIQCDGTGNFCGNGTILSPHASGIGTGILGTGSGASTMNSVVIVGSGGRIEASVAPGIGLDIEGGQQNYVYGTDFESNTTAVKFGANAVQNFADIRGEANTTDFLGATGSNTNVGIVRNNATAVVTDTGTNNHFSEAGDLSAREFLFGLNAGRTCQPFISLIQPGGNYPADVLNLGTVACGFGGVVANSYISNVNSPATSGRLRFGSTDAIGIGRAHV